MVFSLLPFAGSRKVGGFWLLASHHNFWLGVVRVEVFSQNSIAFSLLITD